MSDWVVSKGEPMMGENWHLLIEEVKKELPELGHVLAGEILVRDQYIEKLKERIKEIEHQLDGARNYGQARYLELEEYKNLSNFRLVGKLGKNGKVKNLRLVPLYEEIYGEEP